MIPTVIRRLKLESQEENLCSSAESFLQHEFPVSLIFQKY